MKRYEVMIKDLTEDKIVLDKQVNVIIGAFCDEENAFPLVGIDANGKDVLKTVQKANEAVDSVLIDYPFLKKYMEAKNEEMASDD